MNNTTRDQPVSWAPVLAFGVLWLSVACGGERQTQVASPANTIGQANIQGKTPITNSSTASNVAISEEVLRACNIPDSDAYFQFDSSHLTGFDQAPLTKVAVCFTKGPMAGRKLDLVGHADPRGAPEYNMTLGQSRADAVAGYLTAHGVQQPSVSSTTRGALDATGRDETGWAHDRRVDVVLATR